MSVCFHFSILSFAIRNCGIMDNKPSLSQYFGDNNVPPASQFFDEIGTSPSDMIQSIYLGSNDSMYKLQINYDFIYEKEFFLH